MVENLDSSAGDVSLIPNWGTKIPRAMGQLNLHATTLSQHSRKKKVSLKYANCLDTGPCVPFLIWAEFNVKVNV